MIKCQFLDGLLLYDEGLEEIQMSNVSLLSDSRIDQLLRDIEVGKVGEAYVRDRASRAKYILQRTT